MFDRIYNMNTIDYRDGTITYFYSKRHRKGYTLHRFDWDEGTKKEYIPVYSYFEEDETI